MDVLIIIFIILLIVIIIKSKFNKNNKFFYLNKKQKREYFEKMKRKGDRFEKDVGKKFEENGYKVIYNGILNGIKDEGIDLICKSSNKTFLIQCKNYSMANSIGHEDIKIFHSNAIRFIDLNNLNKNSVYLIYAVPYEKVFDNSAKAVLKDKYYKCKPLYI